MRVDLERVRSPNAIARALSDYGERLNSPHYDQFALLVANGHSATAAYEAIRPGASKATAKVQASILLAHPDMPSLIRGQILGARGKLQAAAPRMADQLLDEALTATKDTKPRIDAINSALDRAGVPRMKEIAISVAADFSAAADAFGPAGSAGVIEGQVIDAEAIDAVPVKFKPHPLELEAYGDTEEEARAAWAKMLPIEELRRIDSAPEPEADDVKPASGDEG